MLRYKRLADNSSQLHFISWMLYHDHAIDIKRLGFATAQHKYPKFGSPKKHTFVKRNQYVIDAKTQLSQNTLELRRKGTKGTQKSSRKGLACEFSTSREHHVVLKM
jgi:hypothetical protein